MHKVMAFLISKEYALKGALFSKFTFTKNFHNLLKQYLPKSSDLYNLEFEENIKFRKTTSNLATIKSLIEKLKIENGNNKLLLMGQLQKELSKLPNRTHPDCFLYGDNPKELAKFNQFPNKNINYRNFAEIAKKLNIFRMDHLANFNGQKSYYLVDSLAQMEHALLRYTINHLKNKKFNLISVPDILQSDIIEGCGMQTSGERNQVYKLKKTGKCLSGTSEMALAGYFKNKVLNEKKLPMKLTAVSRCFRAETSGLQEEKGIYRVHQFTKVEMFSICTENQSEQILELFKEIEIELFKKLGIHFKLLDMPACELGAPAFKKYDMEAWMPGKKMWGEISSCSNCTDYQAKRLDIKYQKADGTLEYVHTINGTACAVPRLLIALLETYQDENGHVQIPEELTGYLNNRTEIMRSKNIPELKLVKNIERITKF